MKTAIASFLIFFSIYIFPETLNVPSEFSTIQSAINAASTGDTVLVEPGTYYENINFSGKNIVVASRFILKKNPEFIHSTIINGSRPADSTKASCVTITSGESPSAILEGFTLTGGKGIVWQDEHGPGQIYTEGGGVFITLSSPTIKDNIIINNEAIKIGKNIRSAGGGGIRCGDSKSKILNNVFIGNKGMYGAGIVLNYCSGMVISNNIFYNNQVYQAVNGAPTFGGGAIWIWNVLPGDNSLNRVVNNTVVSNSALGTGSGLAGRGGGILIASANVEIVNNIIWHNTQAAGGQISNDGSGAISYNLVEGGIAGTGNFNADPLFVDGSFHLQSNSPCIDKGNPQQQYNDPEDLNKPDNALWPSQGTLINDVGVFGGPGAEDYLDLITAVEKSAKLPGEFYLGQNYPNPFNPSTKIDFFLPEAGKATLKIYDITGTDIATLINSYLPAGNHEAHFDASGLSSGIYIYKLSNNKYSEVKKMLLLR